jgi:hypothetical protein
MFGTEKNNQEGKMNRVTLNNKQNKTSAVHYHSTHGSFAEAEQEAKTLNWADPFHRYYVVVNKVYFVRR